MKKKQSIFKIIGLSITIITLLGSIIFVNNLLKEKPGQAVTTIKRTKAAAKTYSRLLALNNPPPTIFPTNIPSPTEILLANINSTPTNSQNQNNQLTPIVPSNMGITNTQGAPTITNTQGTPTVDPTTELLALNRNNTTITTTNSISPTSSIVPTKTKQLPETGWIQYSLILFAAATTMFFLAFIF